ncbi:hypothetical protein NDU88_008277 [Pleurodeles waltl]|uniref:Uncharacterized protein n=1 Tax=Pleurodeles waltl TaxID=8319 RepID=A0AAV7QSC3_PLEWA|nr:hypothetical protein NDU88_008277 [Pleurodeles waltl]
MSRQGRQGRCPLRLPAPTRGTRGSRHAGKPVYPGGGNPEATWATQECQAVDQQDRNPVGLLVGPGPGPGTQR